VRPHPETRFAANPLVVLFASVNESKVFSQVYKTAIYAYKGKKVVRSRLQINTIFNLLLFSSTQTTRRTGPRSSSRVKCGVTCSRIGSTIWLCCVGT
jgi:hypothetical protein